MIQLPCLPKIQKNPAKVIIRAPVALAGIARLYGTEVYQWNKRGLQDNLYYSTADEEQLPLELYQVAHGETIHHDRLNLQALVILEHACTSAP